MLIHIVWAGVVVEIISLVARRELASGAAFAVTGCAIVLHNWLPEAPLTSSVPGPNLGMLAPPSTMSLPASQTPSTFANKP